MPNFVYTARNSANEAMSDVISASSFVEANKCLIAMGLQVVTLRLENSAAEVGPSLIATLELMNESSETLGPALAAYANELPFGPARHQLTKIARDVEDCRMESAILDSSQPHRELLWSVVADQLRSDSKESFLNSVFNSARAYSQERHRLWRVFAYPVAILVFCFGVLTVAALFVIPQFRDLLDDFNLAYSPLTRLIFQLSSVHWMRSMLFLFIAALIAIPLIPRRFYDRVLVWVPIVSRYRQYSSLARFCSAASSLLAVGFDTPQAVEQASLAPGLSLIRLPAKELAQELGKHPQHAPLPTKYPLKATLAFALSDRVPAQSRSKVLRELSDIYREQAERLLSWIESVYEPLLVVFLGLSIGFIFAGILLPLVSLIQNLS